MQHHDSITGTEKQHVACDYHRRLHRGACLIGGDLAAAGLLQGCRIPHTHLCVLTPLAYPSAQP